MLQATAEELDQRNKAAKTLAEHLDSMQAVYMEIPVTYAQKKYLVTVSLKELTATPGF